MRRAKSSIHPLSENGYRVYLPAALTTDSLFPFDAGQEVDIHVTPDGRGIVIVPTDDDIDEILP